jgi:5-(carboxyamino)imidazole ribonucleotide synthase
VWSVIPSSVTAALEQQAQGIASRIAEALGVEGLLAVEMFVTVEGKLLVNELAPRPHNSYHASERACDTSQFEQAVRAVCNLPLGDVEVVRPAAIALKQRWPFLVFTFICTRSTCRARGARWDISQR